MTDTVLCVDIGTTSLKSGLITDGGEVVSFYSYRFDNPCDRFIANEWAVGLGVSLRRLMERGEKWCEERSGRELCCDRSGRGLCCDRIDRELCCDRSERGLCCDRSERVPCNHRNDREPCCDQIDREPCSALRIRALSISGNGPTVVLPSGMTIRWSERIPSYEIPTEQGRKSLFLPKLLALQNLFPEAFERAPYVFSGPEYLIYQLTGNPVTVLPEARFETAYWNDDVLRSVDISPEKLPPFVGVGELCGNITSEIINTLNIGQYLEPGIPVFSAGPDFTAAMIGTNTLSEGKICDRSGSSEGFNFCVPRPVFSDGARSLPSVIPGLWNISVLTPTSSKLSVEKRLKKVAASVAKLREIAKENGLDFPDRMIVTGGQAKSEGYMKQKAKITGMKLFVSSCSDSELIGDACCGWLGLGVYKSLKEAANSIVKESKIYEGL